MCVFLGLCVRLFLCLCLVVYPTVNVQYLHSWGHCFSGATGGCGNVDFLRCWCAELALLVDGVPRMLLPQEGQLRFLDSVETHGNVSILGTDISLQGAVALRVNPTTLQLRVNPLEDPLIAEGVVFGDQRLRVTSVGDLPRISIGRTSESAVLQETALWVAGGLMGSVGPPGADAGFSFNGSSLGSGMFSSEGVLKLLVVSPVCFVFVDVFF